jgi:hypothetical protein
MINYARYTHKLSPALPWKKLLSTGRRSFWPANWN